MFKLDKKGQYGTAHSYGEILRFLWNNRSLSGDFDRINDSETAGEIGAVVDRMFMKRLYNRDSGKNRNYGGHF